MANLNFDLLIGEDIYGELIGGSEHRLLAVHDFLRKGWARQNGEVGEIFKNLYVAKALAGEEGR